MSLSEQMSRVVGGEKDTLKAIINKLGGNVTTQKVDQYPALAAAIPNKLLPNNLLSAQTAALYGLGVSATPNDVFQALKNNSVASTGVWTLIQSYKTAGAYTFTVPAGVTRIGVYMVGGGGSGGAALTSSKSYVPVSTGGASGYGKNVVFDVTPGQTIPIVVGAGATKTTTTYLPDYPNRGSQNGKKGGTTSVKGITVEGGDGGDASSITQANASSAIGGQASGSFSAGSFFNGFNPSPIRYGNSLVWDYNGHITFPQLPREGQNAFDPVMVTLCAGAGSRHSCNTNGTETNTDETILPLPDGTSGGTAAHPDATGNGNGGYGKSAYFPSASGQSVTSGAGADGMVLIYKAGV